MLAEGAAALQFRHQALRDGRQVVADGEVKTIDVATVTEAMGRGQSSALARVSEADYARRPLDEIFPMSLPMR